MCELTHRIEHNLTEVLGAAYDQTHHRFTVLSPEQQERIIQEAGFNRCPRCGETHTHELYAPLTVLCSPCQTTLQAQDKTNWFETCISQAFNYSM